ncbi:helix-turn-helix domain-containing protein [Paenibacillus sp. CAU 1782]
MRNPFQSVRSKLAFSYLIIVLVIALLLSSIFYLVYSHQYREEITINKQMMLNNTVNYIESSIIQRVDQIYLSIALGSPVSIDLNSVQGNHSKIMDIQELLKKQVASHSDLIQGIHLYHAKDRYMISSVHGLVLDINAPSMNSTATDWIKAMKQSDKNSLWMETRKVPQDAFTEISDESSMRPLISYVHGYPFQSSGKDSKIMIAIDIKESALSGIIQNMNPAGYDLTYIVNEHGTVISAADKSMLGSPAEDHDFIQSLISSGAPAGSFTQTLDQEAYVVSHDQLAGTGWTIYNTTPIKTFYYKMNGLREGVLLLCLLAVAVGIALASIFTAAGYSPLKRIMNTIRHRFDSPAGVKLNEYRLIDSALLNLSDKVDNLEETLLANHNIIKHNIVLNMLNNRFTPEELKEQLQSVQVSTDYSRFRCIVIDPVSEKWKGLPPRQIQHTMYSLIQGINDAKFMGTGLLAEELQDHKMVVILCTNQPDDGLSQQITSFILDEAKSKFDLDFVLSLGSWVQQLADIHSSYREAKTLIRYSYFYPALSVIQDLAILHRETSTLEISDSYLVNFEKKLQARDLKGSVQAAEDLIAAIAEGLYSAEYSRIMLLKVVTVYSDCISQVRWQPDEGSSVNLYKQFASIYRINHYAEWIIERVTAFLAHMEKRSKERSNDTITAVKAYISGHLSGDLSLENVASLVFISPKYLSKIFKEETGIVYSEYVTAQRMERARELMAQQDLTVEQVASTVGYRTPAYFIKKFKEIHGCTPGKFMRGAMS